MEKRLIFACLSLIVLFIIPLILAQDFGPFSPFENVYPNQPEYNPYGSPTSPFTVFSGTTTLTQIIQSDWFSGLIMFLIFFTVYLFLLRNFFKEVSVILALLLAIASSAGILIYFGPVIPLIGPYGLVIAVLGILFGLSRNFKSYGKYLPITLLLLAIAWFLFRKYLCSLTWMPYQLCPVMDAIAAIIVLIAIIYGIYRIIKKILDTRKEVGAGRISYEKTQGDKPPKVKFWASPNKINSGQTAMLGWNTRNARRVEISGIGYVKTSGQYPVSPTATTIYYLTAVGDGGATTDAAMVEVSGIPAGYNRKTVYDLQQKYRDYYMRIWNRGLSVHERQRILQAMKVIEAKISSLGGDLPSGASMKPRDIYRKLKKSKLI